MLEAPCIYQKQLLKGGELEILLLSINWFIPNLSLQFTTNAPPNRDTRPDCRGTRKWHTGSGSIIQFTPATWHWHRSNCDHWPLSLTGYMVHWPLCPDSRHVSIIPSYHDTRHWHCIGDPSHSDNPNMSVITQSSVLPMAYPMYFVLLKFKIIKSTKNK